MKRQPSALPPHLVPAPPPWTEKPRPFPLEIEPGPAPRACRWCGRAERKAETELHAARLVLHELEELLVWLRDEHETANRARELAEEELRPLQALLAEFQALGAAHDQALRRARTACERHGAERERARAETAALRERVTSLDRALRQEHERAEKFARYVAALEARLRRLMEAEGDEPPGAARDAARAAAPVSARAAAASPGSRASAQATATSAAAVPARLPARAQPNAAPLTGRGLAPTLSRTRRGA